jgi:raffinose/stachyose/melibiose transport system substrate-binding protein
MKKTLSLVLAGIMVASLAACGSTTSPTDVTTAEDTTSEAANTEAAAAAESAEGTTEAAVESTGEDITLSLWDIWPEGQPLNPIINDYIEQYESEHPNIKIERVSTQEVDYQTTKLRVAGADGSQGDIFSCWGGGYAKSYVDAGVVLPLDEYYEKYDVKDQQLEGATTYCEYDCKIYGLPLKQWAGVMFYNKTIFDEYGLTIPTTFDEMMDCVKVFRENDVTPLVLGAKDGWHIGMIQNALAVRTAGADYMNKALAGEATLNTPEIVKSAELLKELKDAGAFPEGTLGISSDEAEEEFYSGLIPMFFGGSWVAQSINNPDNAVSEDQVVVGPLPTVEGGKGDETQYSGGVIDFFMINANTKHPDEAFDFAIGLTKYLSGEAYILGDSLPCWKDINVDTSAVAPALYDVQQLIQNSTGYVLAWDTFLEGSAIDAHYNLLQGLIEGTVTPEEFAEKMQEAQEASVSDN